MKRKRTLHNYVRIVYRALRRIYGKEKTQDECLRVFKVIFPLLNDLRKSNEPTATISEQTVDDLRDIVLSWKVEKDGQLAALIANVVARLCVKTWQREDLITFYEDITPVAMRIRKLTPRECFRLMDVEEEDIRTIQSTGISNSAQYKLAGNSIVVSCLYYLFRNMVVNRERGKPQQPTELSLFQM